tara:strand:+ start:3960 stop:4718 length:759 start_codon:yes stop_codon:yes gene_type:complete
MDYYTIDSTFSLVKDTMKYYSQNSGKDVPLIDKFVLNKHINYWKESNSKKVDGIFVEVGAFDGITYSNTKAFEESLDWKGLLIEPSPASFQKLTANRPNTINVSTAISKENDEFLEFTGDNCAVAGLTNILEKCIQDNGRQWISAWNLTSSSIDVKIEKMSNILRNNNIKYIDFLSIDVNGSEFEVLETMDWNVPVYVIALNVTTWGKYGKTMTNKCRQLLSSKGFVMSEKLDMDEIWVNDDYFRKSLLLKN